MKIAVKTHIPIPHYISLQGVTYEFNPICDVPKEIGEMMLKNKPEWFFDASENGVDISQYQVKDMFQGKTITEIFAMLSEKDKIDVYTYVKRKVEKARQRELEKQREEHMLVIKKSSQENNDGLKVALGINDVPNEKINEAYEEAVKNEENKNEKGGIKKVR